MSTTVKVQSGDTLYKIARQNNVTVEALCQANKIQDPNRILAGAVLVIPDSFARDGAKETAKGPDAHQSLVDVRASRARKKEGPTATAARHDPETGCVYAKIDGKEVKVGESDAMNMGRLPKVLGEGRYVVWGSQSGGFGYENEGQALHVYDTKTGKAEKLMQEYFMIDDVSCHKLSDGRDALVVRMSDGGLGAPHLAVVDPRRGQVFRAQQSSVGSVEGDNLNVRTHDNTDDIEKPTGKKSYDLRALLDGPVIRNKPDWGAEEDPTA